MSVLVLVHGFMGGAAQWDGYFDQLARQMDIHAVDLPGFGANAHLDPIPSIGGYADWVVDQLRQTGIQRYDLLGHSMGGMIAQEIALRDVDRIDRLVLYATGSIGVLPGRFETIEESKRRAEADGATATARRIAATWFLDYEAAEGFEPCARVAEQSRLPAIHAGLDAMQAWSGRENLGRITPQTLVLWGDQDRTYPWAQIHTLWTEIPHTNLAVIPGCAHAVHAEKTQLFSEVLSDFLSR
ncbi:alpha/beta fold hydrolase [Aestuariivita boseongensis]|uniref:alpha/beta fold hydrolase n=1 Tax=Aestuariivita boseongensis TaxID=1470562 RepID=UPI0009E1F6FC|nr:alpha/beta fold hydrolase [Aestuariivita boseongensis]